MRGEKIFSNKLIYVVSLILTIFSVFVYVLAIIVRIRNLNPNSLGLVLLLLVSIIAFLQIYLLLVNNRKAIFCTNVHLIFLISSTIYELINELVNFGYTSVVNGIFHIIIFLLISIYIINKYKISKINSDEINKIGEREI